MCQFFILYMKFAIGQKKQMTQVFFEDGRVVPVTAVKIDKNVIIDVKTPERDGYWAVKVGSGVIKKKLTKPLQGVLKGLKNSRWIKEFRLNDDQAQNALEKFTRGLEFGVEIFRPGDKVTVTGYSKGRGFQGVVKRHNFAGAPASHGTKDQLRMPGSIGATGPAHVFKGRRMPGHMGTGRVTVKGLEVIKVDREEGVLYIKGALPGSFNSIILIFGPGRFVIKKEEVKKEEEKPEAETKENSDDVQNQVQETQNTTGTLSGDDPEKAYADSGVQSPEGNQQKDDSSDTQKDDDEKNKKEENPDTTDKTEEDDSTNAEEAKVHNDDVKENK